jgi:hypothetical protein
MRVDVARMLPTALIVAACGSRTFVEDVPVPVPVPTACVWKAEDDTTVVCRPKLDECTGPAGYSWCDACVCVDPVLNKVSCSACYLISCKRLTPMFFDGGCSFTYDQCSANRAYQVTCNQGTCQCSTQQGNWGSLGNTTTQDLCNVPPDKLLTTLKQLCEWPFMFE